MKRLIAGWVLAGALGIAAEQAQTIFIARHAERTGEPDPPLNADGQRRAGAQRANRPVEVVAQADFDELVARIRKTAHPDRPTLVIGHRATVRRIVKAHGGGDIPALRSDEHDRLIVLTMLPGGRASTVMLRYGP